jgi:iron(II)-dependent oxidoreductase
MVHKIGQSRKGASPYGCLDMSGNAYEWTSNWYQAYPGNPDVKKEYGQVYYVLRGGSYMSDKFDVRCARRHYDRMDATREDYGLRLVRDAGR